MTTLRKLTIERLRGSVGRFSLPFQKGKRVTIIYGENGTGKSTICDAFDFIGNETVGSLDRPGLGAATANYWPAVDSAMADIVVALESTGGTCTARVGKKGVVVATPPEHRPVVEIFRRRQILDAIEAAPAARYEAISRFIDVSSVEAAESALRGHVRDLKERQKLATVQVRENLDEIDRLWETAGKPSTDAVAWAQAEANRDSSAIEAEAKAIDALYLAYKQLEQHPDVLASAEGALLAVQVQAAEAKQLLEDQVAGISRDAAEVAAILEAARPFLARKPSPEDCPLCESTEKTTELSSRVAARLEAFAGLRNAQEGANATASAAAKAIERLSSQREAAARDARAFESVRASQTWPDGIRLPPETAPEDPSLLKEWLTRNFTIATEWEEGRDNRRASRQSQASLRKTLRNWNDNRKTAEEITAVLPRLELTLKITEEERRSLTDDVLSEISDEVGRLYEQIHPGEGLGKIALELDPKRRASLGIEAKFHGKSAKPQAYFSDSHLDTLGLCVLLALASKDNQERKILVLDDVLASSDEPHVDRLIDVLYAEAAKFRHCIVTTHYRPWKEKLRWGLLRTGQCHFVELSRWSITEGIALAGSVPEIGRLRDLVNDPTPDFQAISAKAGVILEAALDFLTERYECRMPRRPGRMNPLGDLLNAIDKKLRQALRVDVKTGTAADGAANYTTVEIGPLLDHLTEIAQTRNLFGCHFSELSFHLPEADALDFGSQVLLLVESLVDSEDGWPRSDKSGSYWATSDEARRLHPLKQPK